MNQWMNKKQKNRLIKIIITNSVRNNHIKLMYLMWLIVYRKLPRLTISIWLMQDQNIAL